MIARLWLIGLGMVCLMGTDVLRGSDAGPSRTMVWLDFNGPEVPRNGDGDTLPFAYAPAGSFTTAIVPGGVSGSCLAMRLTGGALYAQFNPWNYAGRQDFPAGPRGFARDYCKNPKAWAFDTYNRLRFWIKVPRSRTSPQSHRMEVGTYVKRVAGPDMREDETGNAHYYHLTNLPSTGTWIQVILNMHPNHLRGNPGDRELGSLPRPTGESKVNYFDALTRLYLDDSACPPDAYPAEYRLDEMVFYREPFPENDEQVYTVVSAYLPSSHRIILRWNRNKKEDTVAQEVRYAFFDIHRRGWNAARKAPGGRIVPSGKGGYNGMAYETSDLPLTGRKAVYLAIKPENARLFTQVRIPLELPEDI